MGRGENVVVHKRMSFLASLVWGLCSVIMVTVVCATGIVFYGLTVVDSSSQNALDFVEDLFDDLPAVVKAIPILDDALSNERRFDYVDDLDIKLDFTEHPNYEGRMKAVVTVTNNGEELVSWLAVRVVVKDGEGNILDEDQAFVATPLPFLDDEVPGPLSPGSTRQVTTSTFKEVANPSADYEITELRVWAKNADCRESGSARIGERSAAAVLSSASTN